MKTENPRYLAYLKYCEAYNINTNTYPYTTFIHEFMARIKRKYFKKLNHILIAGNLSDYGHRFFNRYLQFISNIKIWYN